MKLFLTIACICILVVTGCHENLSSRRERATQLTGGSPEQGKRLVQKHGCGTCHVISDIPGAQGMVGPPLDDISRRSYIAGVLKNEPENLVKWIQDPPSIDKKTAMPKLNLTSSQARDVAAYLYSLK